MRENELFCLTFISETSTVALSSTVQSSFFAAHPEMETVSSNTFVKGLTIG